MAIVVSVMEMVGVMVVMMTVMVITCAGVAHDGCGHGNNGSR